MSSPFVIINIRQTYYKDVTFFTSNEQIKAFGIPEGKIDGQCHVIYGGRRYIGFVVEVEGKRFVLVVHVRSVLALYLVKVNRTKADYQEHEVEVVWQDLHRRNYDVTAS